MCVQPGISNPPEVFPLSARRLAAACLCAVALGSSSTAALALAQGPAPAAEPTAPGANAERVEATAQARPASRKLRRAYATWRKRLKRHGAYVGRNLLRTAAAADDAVRPATRRELRHAIHRMQRRLHRYLRTPRGREAVYRLNVRTIPGWGRASLRSIASCESHGDPRAIGGGGAYRGMYQFSFSTWGVVGGGGDPAAASAAEQTWRAWLLLSRHGSGHWPVCG
jgi:predicted nucleic acid-binding protein